MALRFPRVSLLVAPLVLVVALPLHAAKQRAVRVPSDCSFTLMASADAVPSSGEVRVVTVEGASATCTSWLAFSPVDWIVLQPSGSQLFVNIAPNPTQLPRSATLRIAGQPYLVAQDANVVVSPPVETSLLVNGHFDHGLEPWGWQDRYPNGPGEALWSTEDANGSAASGSILMRSTGTTRGFQRLQCVDAESGVIYAYGGVVRAASREGGQEAIAVLEYDQPACGGDFTRDNENRFRANAPLTWQRYDFRFRTGASTRSLLFVIASLAAAPPFDAWFDDLYLRRE
ncbi:MAG: BACON domain-containing protein [Acidobacteria bacterium]|nr:BACON domain-containing protein [Acidobacteriota bacterium]MBV9476544.1 BACON domain-containing protein [Acidobacteriota bacterium]